MQDPRRRQNTSLSKCQWVLEGSDWDAHECHNGESYVVSLTLTLQIYIITIVSRPRDRKWKRRKQTVCPGNSKVAKKKGGMKVYKMGPVMIVKLWAYGAHINSPKEIGGYFTPSEKGRHNPIYNW